MIELSGLFLAALVAATIFPGQSELVLAGLHLTGHHSLWLLVTVATAGNVLGSLINWLMGRYCLKFQDRRWFPVRPEKLQKATLFYQKWGIWTLLLAWAPFIGDPLTLVAGMLRARLPLFLLLVTLGKLARYLLVVSLV